MYNGLVCKGFKFCGHGLMVDLSGVVDLWGRPCRFYLLIGYLLSIIPTYNDLLCFWLMIRYDSFPLKISSSVGLCLNTSLSDS